jgi:hypothetical protein
MHLGHDTNQERRELLRAAAMSVAASATVAILLIVMAGSGASTEDLRCGGCYGYRPSNACKSVQPEISRTSWCPA